MKAERLLIALCGVDEALLHRSELTRKTSWWKGGLAAAACLLAVLFGYRAMQAPAVTQAPPRPVLHLAGADVGEFHLVQLDGKRLDFVLYVNKETYRAYEQGDAYLVEPVLAGPSGLPACRMRITRMAGIPLAEAEAQTVRELKNTYQTVSEPEASEQPQGILIHGGDGTAWDAAQLDVYLVDDREGGTYRIEAAYFTEAAEGHGARFTDMAKTFEVTAKAEAPAWLTALREAANELIPALFANRPQDAAAFLADGAQTDCYDRDVSADVSVSGIDYTVDNDRSPTSAVLSVKHRVGTEESVSYLTIELSYADGRWLAAWAGIEK